MNDTPPLTPDAPTARRWLERELAKGEYHRHESWLHRVTRWLSDHLSVRVGGGAGLHIPGAVVAIVVLCVIAVVLVVSLRRFRPTRRPPARPATGASPVFDGERLDADTYAERAREARAEDPRVALVAAFRAVAARGDELGLLTLTPHSTVADIVTGLRAHLAAPPGATGVEDAERQLGRAGALFERVRYGDGDASASDVDLVMAVHDALRRGHGPGHGEPEGQVPR